MKAYIKNPCHEKYDSMTSTALGKKCAVCNTEVIDFTHWETEEIVRYVQRSKTRICGKLSTKPNSSNYHWSKWTKLTASILLLHTWGLIKAEKKLPNPTIYSVSEKLQSMQDSVTLQFVDPQNKVLPFVYIIDTLTNQEYTLDNKGQIKLSSSQEITIKALLLGYETKIIKIDKNVPDKVIKITLNEQDYSIGETVIKSHIPLTRRLKRWINIFSVRDKE